MSKVNPTFLKTVSEFKMTFNYVEIVIAHRKYQEINLDNSIPFRKGLTKSVCLYHTHRC